MSTPTPLREALDGSVADAEPRRDLATSALARARTHRRQRLAIGGSALAAAAVALGVVVATQPFQIDSAPRPSDVASSAPAPAPPDPDGDGKVDLNFGKVLPRGDDPKVAWMQGTNLHLESGATVELPKVYDDVVSFQGGYLGADESAGTIDAIQDGEVVSSFPGSGLLASSDGMFVAWFEPSQGGQGELKIRFAGIEQSGYSESTVAIPAGLNATPVAFRDQGVLYQTDDQSTGDRVVWFSEGDRGIEIEGASAVGGYDPATDLAVVQTKVTDDGSCWSTYAFPGGEFAGALTEQTCDFSLGEFSADGKYVIGWPAYADGSGPGEVAILDAKTFKPVMQFESGEDYGVMDAVWDGDGDSLIASTYIGGNWQLLRLGVDGSIEGVSQPVSAFDMSNNPFWLTSSAGG